MSRAKCGILIMIPVYAVVLSKVHWVSEGCGNIVEVFLKLIKTFKSEHCLRAGILGDALYLSFIIVLDTYGIGIDGTELVVV